MPSTRWGHEAGRAGLPVLAVPPAVTLLAAAVIAMAHGTSSGGRVVPGAVETLLPLAAGVATASAVSRDRSRELQLSMPASYLGTLARRAALTLGMVAMCAVVLTVAVIGTRMWPAAPGLLAAQLVWLAPAAFLAALGVALSLLTTSGGVAAAVVGVVWLAEVAKPSLFVGRGWQPLYLFASGVVPAAPFHHGTAATAAWWQDRGVVGLAALGLAVFAAVLARHPERLLGSAS